MWLPIIGFARAGIGLPIALCAVTLPLTMLADTPTGEAVYQKRCAACHEQTNPRIPPRHALQQMTSARILRALDAGAMMSIAFTMHRDERIAVASYLGTKTSTAAPPASAFCTDRAVKLVEKPKFSWNGWSPGSDN